MSKSKKKVKQKIVDALGCCPKCGEFELSYGEQVLQDEYLYYPYVCDSCGFEGQEWYKPEFIEHTDSHGQLIRRLR